MPQGIQVLFVSNGYGEDLVSANAAKALAAAHPGTLIRGFPAVGEGHFYTGAGIELAGRGPELPSEGFVRSIGDFLNDVRHGFFVKTFQLGIALEKAAKKYDFLVITGDPYLLMFTSFFTHFPRMKKIFIGVQQSEWYGTRKPFKQHYSLIERRWLKRNAGLIFVRDYRTRDYLRKKGLKHVHCTGNPMMDCFSMHEKPVFPENKKVIGILPGSKREAYDNLKVIFDIIRALALRKKGMLFAFALPRSLEMGKIISEYSLGRTSTFRK